MKRLLIGFALGIVVTYLVACALIPWLWDFTVLAVYCTFKPMCVS